VSIKDAIAASGTGVRTGKLDEVGSVLRGTVIKAELRQARDEDGKPDFWDDGNPKQQVVVIIQTDLDEGEDDNGREDDGRRAFYVKFWGNQKLALLDAIRAAEVDDIYPGADFAVKWTGNGEAQKKAWSAPKLLKFKVGKPPVKGAGLDEDDFEDEVAVEEKPAARREVKPAAVRKQSAEKPSAAKALADAGLDADDF
jgi:hypothetical protein